MQPGASFGCGDRRNRVFNRPETNVAVELVRVKGEILNTDRRDFCYASTASVQFDIYQIWKRTRRKQAVCEWSVEVDFIVGCVEECKVVPATNCNKCIEWGERSKRGEREYREKMHVVSIGNNTGICKPVAHDVHFFSVLSLASFGPLAPFNTLVAVGGGDYFALFNATHDEIDLDGPFADGLFAPRPFPDLVNIELYGCGGGVAEVSPICVQDFAFNPYQFYGHVSFGPIEYTVSTVATPEGSTRLHLLVGVGLGLLGMHAVTRVR